MGDLAICMKDRELLYNDLMYSNDLSVPFFLLCR